MRKMWLVCGLSLFSLVIVCRAVPLHRETSASEGGLYFSRDDKKFVNESVCIIDDVLYNEGDPIPSQSPCQRCLCEPPEIKCEDVKCEVKPGCKVIQHANQCCPEYKCECDKNGTTYQNGERLDDPTSPCRACYCQSGEIVCRVLECYRREDCKPRDVPGKCCPKYDHCPPVEPTQMTFYTSTSSETINPSSYDYQNDMADTPNTSDENIQDNSVDTSQKTGDILNNSPVFGSNTVGDYSEEESSLKPASTETNNESDDNTEKLYQDSTELHIKSINITETNSEDENEKEESQKDNYEHSESIDSDVTSTEIKEELQKDSTEPESATTTTEDNNSDNKDVSDKEDLQDTTEQQTESREESKESTTQTTDVVKENVPLEDLKDSASIAWYEKDISAQNLNSSNSEESSERYSDSTTTFNYLTSDSTDSVDNKDDSGMLNDDGSKWHSTEDEKTTTETETKYEETSTTTENGDEGEIGTEHYEVSTESSVSDERTEGMWNTNEEHTVSVGENEETMSLKMWNTNEENTDSGDENESKNKEDTTEKNQSENLSNDSTDIGHIEDTSKLLRNHSSETIVSVEDNAYSNEESSEHEIVSTTATPETSDRNRDTVPVITLVDELASPNMDIVMPDDDTVLSDESGSVAGELVENGDGEQNDIDVINTTTDSPVTEITTEYHTTDEMSKETYSVKQEEEENDDDNHSEIKLKSAEFTTANILEGEHPINVENDSEELSSTTEHTPPMTDSPLPTENTDLSGSGETVTEEEVTDESGLSKSDEITDNIDITSTFSTTEHTTNGYDATDLNKFPNSQEKILPQTIEIKSNTTKHETSVDSSEISDTLPGEWLKSEETTTETNTESVEISKEQNSEELIEGSVEDDSAKSETTTESISTTASSFEEKDIHSHYNSEFDSDSSKVTIKRYSKTDAETVNESDESSGDYQTTESSDSPVGTEATNNDHEVSTTPNLNSYETETTSGPNQSTESNEETDGSAHNLSEDYKSHESGESYNSGSKEHDKFDKNYPYYSSNKKSSEYADSEIIYPKEIYNPFFSDENLYGSTSYIVPSDEISKENYTSGTEELTSRESTEQTESTDETVTPNDDQSTDSYERDSYTTTETVVTETSVDHSDEDRQGSNSEEYDINTSVSTETTTVPENVTQNATRKSEDELNARKPDSFQKSEEMQISSMGLPYSWEMSDYGNSKDTKLESTQTKSLRNVKDKFSESEYEEESEQTE
ncbi:dentin sialophosphoprotein [Periplaneta americana]|uniref:dentin sialophosphoprotein n=1 Tax=Periplaneta americana TaxID=6978 RepID=UPI0037E818D5